MNANFISDEQITTNGVSSELLTALQRLNLLLSAAVQEAEALYGAESPVSRFRGLVINRHDADRYATQSPFSSRFDLSSSIARVGLVDLDASPTFAWLASQFGLCSFDVDALLIALAPDFELRYERLYGFIQDDVTRRRPTMELVLDLLCSSPEQKLTHRTRLSPDGPLIRHRLAHLVPDSNHIHPPLLGHYLKPDAQVVSLLLSETSLDARLAGAGSLVDPVMSVEELVLAEETSQALQSLSESVCSGSRITAWFSGPVGSGKTSAVETLAKIAASKVLHIRLDSSDVQPLSTVVHVALREGLFKKCLVHFQLHSAEAAHELAALLTARHLYPSVVVSAVVRSPAEFTSHFVPVHFEPIAPEDRRRMWVASLKRFRATAGKDTLNILSRRFRMRPGQIYRAAEVVGRRNASLTRQDLSRAARSQSLHGLAGVACRIEPVASWTDLVLPEDTTDQLRELCLRIDHFDQVFNKWGFARKLPNGRGNTALFAGPSGVGKTMAAEVVANELGIDLYRIDLARIVSKYIGETEKNLDRVFVAAEDANAILFFDEADALFGKRSEVKDARDRYANIEISYLLQKMEEYEGIAILASNLRQNLDDAFVRRLAFTIHFPFPDEAHRRRIWERIWPKEIPMSSDVDVDFLARQFKLSGGHIKNIALAATFAAAAEGRAVTWNHLVHCLRREYEKLGKSVSEHDLRRERQGHR